MFENDEEVDRGDNLTEEEVEKTEVEETPEGKETDSLEDDETPEEKAEREAAEAEEAKKKRARIPLSRHEDILAKARKREEEALAEVERLKAGMQSTATQKTVIEHKTKIDELQDKYEDLILDGKRDEARKVRKQLEAMREELSDFVTTQKSEAARKAAVEELTYNAQLAGIEAKYPELNRDHGDYDQEKVNEVVDLLEAFVTKGASRAAALARAVKYVMGEPAKATASPDAAQKLADKRAEEARRKAAAANAAQPPNANRVGLDSDKGGKGGGGEGVDIMRMSQDKFAKLEEETLAKLRGDEVS